MNINENVGSIELNSMNIKKEPVDDFCVTTNVKETILIEHDISLINSQKIILDDFHEHKKNKSSILQYKINSLLRKAKILYCTKSKNFLLNCSNCRNIYQEVKIFLGHVCYNEKSKLPKELHNFQRIKKPVVPDVNFSSSFSSVGTETNLILGEDGLWHCRICDKGYEKKNSLKKHEQAHLKTYTCEVCGKGLKSGVNLREHMNAHTGSRPYQCNICPMAFARKWGLTSHVRSHIGDKRYSCEYCGKKFVNGSILKIHVRMIHTKEKPCQCEVCGQHFYSNQLLNEHKKRHNNIRPYKCDQCEKCFFDKKQLTRHFVAHSDEKPFACDLCPARFPRRKTLQAHLKIHSGIKDHICPICGKGFAMNYNLTSHLKSHANGKVKAAKDSSSKKRVRKTMCKIKLEDDEQKTTFTEHKPFIPILTDTNVNSTNILTLPSMLFQIPHLQN